MRITHFYFLKKWKFSFLFIIFACWEDSKRLTFLLILVCTVRVVVPMYLYFNEKKSFFAVKPSLLMVGDFFLHLLLGCRHFGNTLKTQKMWKTLEMCCYSEEGWGAVDVGLIVSIEHVTMWKKKQSVSPDISNVSRFWHISCPTWALLSGAKRKVMKET